MRRIRKHLSFANLVSVIALFLVLGGGAIAAINPKARSASARWAVVSSNGHLVKGAGAVSADRLFTSGGVKGSYQVKFKRKVKSCALTATIGLTNAANRDPDPGEIGVAYRHGNSKAVYVKTRDSDGVEANRSFHLSVLC